MELNKLSIKDRSILRRFLATEEHSLSAYALENIYIWQGLYDIRWQIADGCLSLFFIDKIGCFLYLSPLGSRLKTGVLRKAFEVMDTFNKNKDISRIENVEEKELGFYQAEGFECRLKSYDYICQRSDLAGLRGNKFKSKRACCNYFNKHYAFEYQPFSLKHKESCLKLYNFWMEQRKAKRESPFYQGMLEDSKICLKNALEHYSDFNFTARIVKIGKEVKAFTFGYGLNKETFCVLYEITDLAVKGLAQFIFRSFCSELGGYKYINIMDDSGLENLREVKLSYKPVKRIPSFTVIRNK